MTSTSDSTGDFAAPVTERAPTVQAAERAAVAFARLLRTLGLRVSIDSVLTLSEALAAVGLRNRTHVYWAARSTLVHRPEDIDLFDRAFAVFWDRRSATVALDAPPEMVELTIAMDADDGDDDAGPDDDDAEASDDDVIELRFSATEVLRDKDFAAYSAEELVLAQQLMTQLRLIGVPRSSRRLLAAKRRGPRSDLRRTVAAALRTDGEPIRRAYRQPGQRLRRLVLLLDISGSMEPYARALLRFVQAAVAGRQKVEAFAIGTRLTRVTRELNSRDPDRALQLAAERVHDWSGGTRLGLCLRQFNDQWGVRGMARGAIVVVLSDGWDRGDPGELAEQMARLQRVAYKLVWVNPLKVTPGYAPLARGMAAALPYVDAFVEGHSVTALQELADVISSPNRPAFTRPTPGGSVLAGPHPLPQGVR